MEQFEARPYTPGPIAPERQIQAEYATVDARNQVERTRDNKRRSSEMRHHCMRFLEWSPSRMSPFIKSPR